MEAEDSFKINLQVESPQLKVELGGASKYFIYHIHGEDKFAEFSIYRRYSDFVLLKNSMMVRWPGVYVPPLPQKKFIGNNDVEFVDYRRNGLQQFLRMISKVEFLWYADQFQLFMKNNSTDVEKSLGNLGKTNFREISTKYESVFSQKFEKVQTDSSLSGKIQEFKAYIKNSQILLEKMNKVAQSMTETRKKFQEKYIFLLSTILPDYEQKCIVQYLQSQDEASWNLYFTKNSSQNLSQNVRQLSKTFGLSDSSQSAQSQKTFKHNALSLTNELVKQQIRELINFNEILLGKEQYDSLKHRSISKVKDLQLQESKITAGKQSIVSKLKNQNKQEQLKNNKILLQKAKIEQQQIQKVCRLIQIILVDHELERFKSLRQKNYYKVVKMIASAQNNMYEAESQLWNKIAGFQGEMGVKNDSNDEEKRQKNIMTEIKVKQEEKKSQQNELKEKGSEKIVEQGTTVILQKDQKMNFQIKQQQEKVVQKEVENTKEQLQKQNDQDNQERDKDIDN